MEHSRDYFLSLVVATLEVCFLPVGSFCKVKSKLLAIKLRRVVKVSSLAPSSVYNFFFFEGTAGNPIYCPGMCQREGRGIEAERGKKRGYA